ncbi:hypothetical protein AALP_AAs42381U000100, partial [Arabis alpina]
FNHEGEIPQELMALEGMKVVWIIRVNGKETNFRQSSYKVVKVTTKPETIQRFEDNVILKDSNSSEVPLLSNASNVIQLEITSSEANDNALALCSSVTSTSKRPRTVKIEDSEVQ